MTQCRRRQRNMGSCKTNWFWKPQALSMCKATRRSHRNRYIMYVCVRHVPACVTKNPCSMHPHNQNAIYDHIHSLTHMQMQSVTTIADVYVSLYKPPTALRWA